MSVRTRAANSGTGGKILSTAANGSRERPTLKNEGEVQPNLKCARHGYERLCALDLPRLRDWAAGGSSPSRKHCNYSDCGCMFV